MNALEWLTIVAGTFDAARFVTISLREKCMMYDRIPIVENGVLVAQNAPLPDGSTTSIDSLMGFDGDPFAEVEKLYAQFKRSVPGKSEQLSKGCFKACSSDSLDYEELVSGMPRMEARLLLEGFIVLASSAGILRWKNQAHFYWQGADRDLILYREWI